MPTNTQKSGKNKKYGRNKKRPSAIRYLAENRCAKNKTKRLRKHLHRLNKQGCPLNPKVIGVPRGTQRRKDRIAEGKTK